MNRTSTPRRRLGPAPALVLLASATVTIMSAASAPSPIYPLYRERWHFSVMLMTVIFAVYVVGLLTALLTVGSLSDHVGPRPVLVGAFLLAATGTGIFWGADGPAALIVARLFQGTATGTAMSGLAAGLVDLSPKRWAHLGATLTAVATSIGMAAGAALAGFLVGVTSRPDAVVFPVLTLLLLTLALSFLALPEPKTRRRVTLLELRPSIRVTGRARAQFWTTFPSTFTGWAATGFFLALVPFLVRDVIHLRFAAAGGFTVAVLYIAVTIGGLWSVRYRWRTATLLGAGLMTTGTLVLALGLASGSLVEFTVSAVGIGLGVGLTFSGNMRAMGAVSIGQTRSETFAAVYVVSYAALSIPILIAGMLVPYAGLETTGLVFIAFIGLLSAATFVHAVLIPDSARQLPGRLRDAESDALELLVTIPATSDGTTCAQWDSLDVMRHNASR